MNPNLKEKTPFLQFYFFFGGEGEERGGTRVSECFFIMNPNLKNFFFLWGWGEGR